MAMKNKMTPYCNTLNKLVFIKNPQVAVYQVVGKVVVLKREGKNEIQKVEEDVENKIIIQL